MRYSPSEEMSLRLPIVAALARQCVTANEAAEHLARRIVELEQEAVRLRASERVERMVIMGDGVEMTWRKPEV